MRGANADFRAVNNALDTINAAANAIASAENHVPQATVQKRRWGTCWSLYWCFGSYKHKKRIGHAVLVPETTAPGDAPAAENPTQAPTIVPPFVAPPSSPESFLPSEPPSATHSPVGLLSLTSVSANMYSPSGPASIFAIGPYAHETQLVSPPAFSTFTTEPSTAPFTPPPESVHLTTPSSPEVPFAQLFNPNFQNAEAGQRFPFSNCEFQCYQLYPGSPLGQLISPSSGISGSGTSSPFPDGDFVPAGLQFPEFQMGDPPKLLKLNKLYNPESGSRLGSATLTSDGTRSTPPNGFASEIVLPLRPRNSSFQNEQVADRRVSFELGSEDVVRCVEKELSTLSKQTQSKSIQNGAKTEEEENAKELVDDHGCRVCEISNGAPEKAPENGQCAQQDQNHQSITTGSTNEFNFDSADGRSNVHKPIATYDWWANEKVVGRDDGSAKNWTFFPMIQPGILVATTHSSGSSRI